MNKIHRSFVQSLIFVQNRMNKFGMNLGKSLIKGHMKGGSSPSQQSGESSNQKPYSKSDFLKDAKNYYKTRDASSIDPRAMEFAATKIQAGWKGYKVRKGMDKKPSEI
ncbi:hypothetical protein TCAL_02036 [Tigriopus californicus]|uniref:Uncharacterized protein n=1 Tax=Tigriopus californicus TaxID=6832 RepID=A0A553NBU1_TIGCA|nr:hypothetical protein TCAL_02036 [Tigriopus californicus]|eukprot:TCALIF_02036-PA protein Name:"Protein of unknown function" AED:0.09 eAED:0.09 QI:0/0.5/0.33/0.66/1/1/3/684/107